MTTKALARKAELYYRLHGFETVSSLVSCCKCRYKENEKCHPNNRRCIFVEWDKNGHWIVKGYGIDFGLVQGTIYSFCVEFLDNKE